MSLLSQEGKAMMLTPHQALTVPHRGVPDAYMEKLPSLEERRHTRDPRTQQFIESGEPQDHAA